MNRKPHKGQVWKHINGNQYKVLNIANGNTERPEQYPITVVYQNIDNGTIWSRKLDDWHRSMEYVEDCKETEPKSLEELAESFGIPMSQVTEEGEGVLFSIVFHAEGIQAQYMVPGIVEEIQVEGAVH